MSQVMVNFRIDEDVKKSMEQACKEMGLSMTTAFTIFATKVGKEKRIPFEVTADSHIAEYCERQHCRAESRQGHAEVRFALERKQERLEMLCAEIRRSLTSIHTAIPSSITGLSMERIRLLCGDELKDKAAGVSSASRNLFSNSNAQTLKEKDLRILEEYINDLSSISEDIREMEQALIPAMRAWTGEDVGDFELYEQRLAAASRGFDELQSVMRRFLRSTAHKRGGARSVQARIQQAAMSVGTTYVLTAVENLAALILQHYDSLDDQTKARLESFYLQTLELTLQELGQAEQDGEESSAKAALCLRAVNVLSQVISDSRQAHRELSERNLEAEVVALERFAAMRGDIAGTMKPES